MKDTDPSPTVPPQVVVAKQIKKAKKPKTVKVSKATKVSKVPKVSKVQETKKKDTKKPPKKAVVPKSKAVKKTSMPKDKPKAGPKRAKGAKKEAKCKGYTEDEQKRYKDLVATYSAMTNDQLKGILRANAQSMTGDKNKLVDKCADGELLGAMPKCNACGGGYLKWDSKKGKSPLPQRRHLLVQWIHGRQRVEVLPLQGHTR